MAKPHYDIDGREFQVEKRGSGWAGWFIDSPDEVITANLKRDMLAKVGYLPPHPGGISITFRYEVVEDSNGEPTLVGRFSNSRTDYAPPRTVQDAYDDYRKQFAGSQFFV